MAGSWINGNFGIWIGHNEDNTSWQYVGQTRDFIVEYTKQHPEFAGSELEKQVWKILYAAEGSDWNWWYGDDHSSGNDGMFDLLFRQHLIAIYTLLNTKVPDYLYKAIKGQQHSSNTNASNFSIPTSLITPTIDGEITNFFEWKRAGVYIVGHSGGSMHQVASTIKTFNYGFDLENIYLALNLNIEPNSKEIENFNFNINFFDPIKSKVSFKFDIEHNVVEFNIFYDETKEVAALPVDDIKFKSIIELKIPLKILKLPEEYKKIEFTISVDKDNMEVERWPDQSSVIIPKPTKNFNILSWTV